MKVNTTRLGQAGITFALIGVIMLFIPSLQEGTGSLGFAIITFGFLMVILSYVMDRLKVMGAEYWALGSIIVYIGTLIVSSPMFLFSFGIEASTATQWLLAGIGLTLVLLGFVTTKYDLNIKLISAFNKLVSGLQHAMERAINRIKNSPLITLIAVLLLYLIFTIFTDIETLIYPALSIFGVEQSERNVQIVVGFITLLLMIIETREFIWTFLAFGFNALSIGARVALEWITRLPLYVRNSGRFIKSVISTSFSYVGIAFVKLQENFQSILEGLPMLSLIGGLGYFIAFLRFGNQGLLFVATVLFIVPASVLFVANPEWVRRRIERVQTFSYQVGQRSRQFYRRNRELQCRNCGNPVLPDYINCPICGTEIEYCSICRSRITYGEDFERCSICANPIHTQHLEDWTRLSSKCPWCKEEWKPKGGTDTGTSV